MRYCTDASVIGFGALQCLMALAYYSKQRIAASIKTASLTITSPAYAKLVAEHMADEAKH